MADIDKLAGPDGGETGHRLAKFWLDQIADIKDSAEMKRWVKRGNDIEKRYRDERTRSDDEGQRRYSSLWSNVEILTPALYGKPPIPVAERRFKDKDPVGRGAAQMLERALRNEVEISGFDEALNRAVRDYLLPGRGTVWVRYEPEIEEGASLAPEPHEDMRDSQGSLPSQTSSTSPRNDDVTITRKGRVMPKLNAEPEGKAAIQEKLDSTGDRVVRESTPVDFVHWPDFFTFPVRARTWTEVTAVGKRVYMSRDQMTKRFGKRIGKHIPLDKDDRGQRSNSTTLQSIDQDKGQVFEIWSKVDQTVYWVAQGYDYLCDRKDDPLQLENFYPTPRPLYANPTNNTLVPVPDYIQYQDQAMQIDELSQRIAMLTKCCKMAGLYNAAAKDVQRLFNESVENELIPVDDWAAFGKEGGGIEGNWSLMPVADIIQVINELMMAKEKQIEEMDRLTGLNDILRGTSDARETLGGVRLKSNNTGTRLTHRQNEVARFARDTVRIMADIMCRHFSPQSLIDASGVLYEEGLGAEDTPSLSDLQTPGMFNTPTPQGSPFGGPPAMPPSPPAQGGGPLPSPAGGPGGGGMAGGPPTGQNVIPFPGAQSPPGGPGGPMGVPQPQVPPELEAKLKSLQRIACAIKLLRNERLRGFRVDLEVDSTIYADTAQDKQDRHAFADAITNYLQMSMQMGAAMPESVPLLGKMLQFIARGHPIGRDLETAIEDFTDEAMIVAKKKAAEPQPNPEMLKAQASMMMAQSKVQSDKIKSQGDQQKNQADMQRLQVEMQNNQLDLQASQMDAEAQKAAADAEVQRQALENQGEERNAQFDMQMKKADVEMKLIEKRMEEIRMQLELYKMRQEIARDDRQAELDRQKMAHEVKQDKREDAQSKLEMKHEKEQTGREAEFAEEQHERDMEKAKADAKLARAKAAAPKSK